MFETLYNIQLFISYNFARVGFLVVFFLHLCAVLSKEKVSLAYQIVRFAILINLALLWINFVSGFFRGVEVFHIERFTGPYATAYILMFFCSMILPLLLGFPKLGRNVWVIALLSFLSHLGFWMERWTILIISMHRDFLPIGDASAIDLYSLLPWSLFLQSFFSALLLFSIALIFKSSTSKTNLITNS